MNKTTAHTALFAVLLACVACSSSGGNGDGGGGMLSGSTVDVNGVWAWTDTLTMDTCCTCARPSSGCSVLVDNDLARIRQVGNDLFIAFYDPSVGFCEPEEFFGTMANGMITLGGGDTAGPDICALNCTETEQGSASYTFTDSSIQGTYGSTFTLSGSGCSLMGVTCEDMGTISAVRSNDPFPCP